MVFFNWLPVQPNRLRPTSVNLALRLNCNLKNVITLWIALKLIMINLLMLTAQNITAYLYSTCLLKTTVSGLIAVAFVVHHSLTWYIFRKNSKLLMKVISLPCKMLSTGAAVQPPRCTPRSWSSPAGQTTGNKWEEGRTQQESCQTAALTPLLSEARVSSREVTQCRKRGKKSGWADTFVKARLNLLLKHPLVARRPEISGYII